MPILSYLPAHTGNKKQHSSIMRTKTLLFAAALGLATVATSMAQAVYSVNAVGFVNRSVPPGFSIIANPLKNGDNSLGTLFPVVPTGTTIYKFVDGAYKSYFFVRGAWNDPTVKLEPGEGAFIKNTTTEAFNVTFVGEVPTGENMSINLPAGYSLVASHVPQALVLKSPEGTTADLNFPAVNGDTIYFFRNGAYQSHPFIRGGWTTESGPVPEVGEGFFVKKGAATTWTRSFSVNQ
jgi:hypothetical protein